MNLKISVWLLALTLVGHGIAGEAKVSAPTHVLIHARYMGWSSKSTNLTLIYSNGAYAAGAYSVPAPVVSNLLAVARRPWTYGSKANSSRAERVDPVNLGLDASWVKNNRERLLRHYADQSGQEIFPNASARQRAWLTNALADPALLQKCMRHHFGTFSTDDYPQLELRFEKDDGRTVEQLFRIGSRSQHACMLPWVVFDGTSESTNFNADISRALAQVLPSGFLLRDRLGGDLLRLVTGQFLDLSEVQAYIRKSTFEQTFGADADRFLKALRNPMIYEDSPQVFPNRFQASFHQTNWPDRLTMPIETGIAHGIVTNLPGILKTADAKVAPLLQCDWLISRLKSSRELALAVPAEGTPDHQWLRGHMEKVGLGAFYARVQPALRRPSGFLLREGTRRASYWAILADGRYLLYGFSGNGVLDWKPEELGFKGPPRTLDTFTIHYVGVYVGPDGKITEVVQPGGS